ncbi:26S proteasome non-ATPase regulatory subunit 1 homolog A-like protein [Tanacetum coccineum]
MKFERNMKAEMKKHMEIVQDDKEITIDDIPLATKPLMIVEYKIVKEGQKGFYHLIRLMGMYALALAYAGTSNSKAIHQLLHFVVSDISDDVRRTVVLALGFVLYSEPEQETVEGNTKSAKELAAAEDIRNVKTEKDEVLDSDKVLESLGKVDEGTCEVAAVNDNTKTLDGKAEAEDGKIDNAKMGDDPMSEDTSIIKEEVAVTVKKEKPEVGSTMVEVQKVTEEGHVMDEAQADVDVVGRHIPNENPAYIDCVVNAEVNVTYPKAKVDVTDTLFGHVAPTKSGEAKLLTKDWEGALADIKSGQEDHLMLAVIIYL